MQLRVLGRRRHSIRRKTTVASTVQAARGARVRRRAGNSGVTIASSSSVVPPRASLTLREHVLADAVAHLRCCRPLGVTPEMRIARGRRAQSVSEADGRVELVERARGGPGETGERRDRVISSIATSWFPSLSA
ncbi:MAG: hypothetical protein OXI81_03775 [Paracoccaceae bacterium]|nr:hypothetical protein [Paracoccaceae bacterium]